MRTRTVLPRPPTGSATFGVAGGTYDTIQKSLLSARHAWHLYHALQYFEGNEPALRRFAAGHELDDVMAVIDQTRVFRLGRAVAVIARTPASAGAILATVAFSGSFFAITRIPGFPTDRSITTCRC